MTAAYRYALVELYVDLPGNPYPDVGDAIYDAILADPESRARAVAHVLDALDGVACERVLFPGWTLVGTELPPWVLDRTAGRTLVLELLPGELDAAVAEEPDGRRWRAFVVRDGQVLVGPVFQLFWSGDGAGRPGSPTREAEDLTAQLAGRAAPGRTWEDPGWPEAALMLCGEVNVIHAPLTTGAARPVVDGFPSFDLVMNPAHKPNRLPAMTRKRRYLSQMRPAGLLLSTANTHGPWRKAGGGAQSRRTTAAEAYCGAEDVTPSRAVAVGRHRILLFT